MAKDVHYVLVHGTYGISFIATALWSVTPKKYRQGSVDWPVIRERLAESGATVHSFVWSGKNNHRARMQAGVELRRQLLEIASTADCIYVIAHSHGGNVFLYALDDPVLSEKVDGVVFMATPFLHFHRHEFTYEYIRATLAVLAMFGVVIPAAMFAFMQRMFSWEFMNEMSPISLGVLALLFVLGIGVWRLLVAVVDDWRPEYASRDICRKLQPKAPRTNTSVLIVRHVGDEAGIFLNAGSLVELAISSVWKISQLTLYPLMLVPFWVFANEKRAKTILTVAVVSFLVALAASPLNTFRVLFGALGLLLLIQVTIGVIHVLLGLGVLVLNAIRFGGYGILSSAFLRVSTEATPAGQWAVELFESDSGGLAHSKAYQDPKVVERIVEWLKAIP